MSRPRWLLITVSDHTESSRAHLGALLASVERQDAQATMVLVMRGGVIDEHFGSVDVHQVDAPMRIPLSVARNLALVHAQHASLLSACDFVAFPDDDASYPDGLLQRAAAALTDAAPVVCGPYAPSAAELDRQRFPARALPLRPELVMRVLSSNNVLCRAEVVQAVGGFDERFGLGARYGAGEDSDYVLRALELGFAGVYDPSLLVQHPYKASRPAQYYPGNVAVLARHLCGGGTAWLLARRLVAGMLMTAARQLSVSEYSRCCAARSTLA